MLFRGLAVRRGLSYWGPPSVCSQCLAGYTCESFQCIALPVPPAAPPVAPPPTASPTDPPAEPPSVNPGPVNSCPPPAPFGAICVEGAYIVRSNVTTGGQVVVSAPTVVEGSLTLNNGSTIVLQNSAKINVTGCLSVGGSLVVALPSSATGAQNISVIEFSGGYCGGQATTFDNVTVTIENAAPCSKVTSQADYGARSISVLYTYDIQSCAPADASALALSIGAIVGIAVACAAVVGLVIATVVWSRFRARVLPFEQRRVNAPSNDHELE
jgi:hypothetical protein